MADIQSEHSAISGHGGWTESFLMNGLLVAGVIALGVALLVGILKLVPLVG